MPIVGDSDSLEPTLWVFLAVFGAWCGLEVHLSLGLCLPLFILVQYVKHLITKLYNVTILHDSPQMTCQDLSLSISKLCVFCVRCKLYLTALPQLRSYFELLPCIEKKGVWPERCWASSGSHTLATWEVNSVNHRGQVNTYSVLIIAFKHLKVKLFKFIVPWNKDDIIFYKRSCWWLSLRQWLKVVFICILCVAVTVQTLKISSYQDLLS